MRSILGIVLTIVATGVFLDRFAPVETEAQVASGSAAVAAQTQADDWRRTADGWERKSSWKWLDRKPVGPRAVWKFNPLALALLLLMISLAALISCSHPRGARLNFVFSGR